MNDELRKRIFSDEPIESSDSEHDRMSLIRRFEAAQKKQLIRLTIWLVAALGIFFAGAWCLGKASDHRTMLAAVVVMLIGFETTVLVKLWYWAVDGRLRTVEEIKRLEAMLAGESVSENSGQPETQLRNDNAGSRRQRWTVKSVGATSTAIVMIVALAGSLLFLGPLFKPRGVQVLATSESHATLTEDGVAHVTARLTYTYYGITPTDTVEIRTKESLSDLTCQDAQGNDLACQVTQTGGEFRYMIRLAGTLFRGEAVDLRLNWSSADMIKQQDGKWVFTGRGPWREGLRPYQALTQFPKAGCLWVRLKTTGSVALPAGANVESVPPQSMMQWNEKDRRVLFFDQPHKALQDETIQVTYRLSGRDTGSE